MMEIDRTPFKMEKVVFHICFLIILFNTYNNTSSWQLVTSLNMAYSMNLSGQKKYKVILNFDLLYKLNKIQKLI